LKALLHHFSKVKSQKEVTKRYKSRVFLLFLLNDRRIRIRIHTSDYEPDPDPGGPKTSGSGDVHPKLVQYLALEYGVNQNPLLCFFAYIQVLGK
jgi:hypothetical protein